jgi:hypothetical protein
LGFQASVRISQRCQKSRIGDRSFVDTSRERTRGMVAELDSLTNICLEAKCLYDRRGALYVRQEDERLDGVVFRDIGADSQEEEVEEEEGVDEKLLLLGIVGRHFSVAKC